MAKINEQVVEEKIDLNEASCERGINTIQGSCFITKIQPGSDKEPVEIIRQKDSWQDMRELGIEIKNESVVCKVVNLLLNSKLSYLDANEALREADRALRHKAFTAT